MREARRMMSCVAATSASMFSMELSITRASCTHPTQPDPRARSHDAGETHDVCRGRLDWPIRDRAYVEFRDAGATHPTHGRAHDAGIERVRNPVLRPAPVLVEQTAVLIEHLVSGEGGNT